MKLAPTVLAVALTTGSVATVVMPIPASAVSPAATVLAAEVPATVEQGDAIVVRATLTDGATATALEAASVDLLRGRPDDDIPDVVVASGTTDATGVVDLVGRVDRSRPFAHFYARFEGTQNHAASASPAGRTRIVGVVVGTTTSLTAPSRVTLRRPVTVRATVSGAGDPDATGSVRFERQTPSGWTAVKDVPVGRTGSAAVSVTFTSASTRLRARYRGADGYSGSASHVTTVTGVRQRSTLTLKAPRKVIDERSLRLSARLRTRYTAVAGARVSFQVYRNKKWRTYRTARTNRAGVAKVSSIPRHTYKYRAVTTAGDYFTRARSSAATVKNVPPGKVVRLPKKAPTPDVLPAQPRAKGRGANATISTISTPVWKSMTGRSWRVGCPVGRDRLRIVRVNYWGFDGYRHRGELVVHVSIAHKTARAFTDLYRNEVSIRSMYRVDRFGYSARLRGANDYASMAADNTSAFNCRYVVGSAGVRSPHSWGRSIDLNPFENPFRSVAHGWVPNTWWRSRSAGTYAWTKKSHLVPRIMKRNGFRWTYGTGDGHHFDG